MKENHTFPSVQSTTWKSLAPQFVHLLQDAQTKQGFYRNGKTVLGIKKKKKTKKISIAIQGSNVWQQLIRSGLPTLDWETPKDLGVKPGGAQFGTGGDLCEVQHHRIHPSALPCSPGEVISIVSCDSRRSQGPTWSFATLDQRIPSLTTPNPKCTYQMYKSSRCQPRADKYRAQIHQLDGITGKRAETDRCSQSFLFDKQPLPSITTLTEHLS